jgi:hypothetical protein
LLLIAAVSETALRGWLEQAGHDGKRSGLSQDANQFTRQEPAFPFDK